MIAGVGVAWIAYTFARRQSTAKAAWLIPAALGILIFVDLSAASKPFVIPHAYKHILDENSVTRYLNENTNRGRVKILPPQHPLMNNWRLGFLSAKGYDLFDPISISRMPQNYEAFFQAMGNDMLRLWSLGSVRYFVCLPDYAAQLKKMSRPGAEFVTRLKFGATQDVKGNVIPSNSVPDNQKVLELIEYTGAMPFHYFAQTWHIMDDSPEGDAATLSELASPQFDYRTSALIQGEGLSAGTGASGNISVTYRHPTRETLAVSLPAPGLLVRTTEYDARWEVTIDGEPAPLVRANALFQAVHVPEGKHIIMFAFKPSIEPLYISLTGRCLFLIAIGAALLFERKARIIEDKDYDSERT